MKLEILHPWVLILIPILIFYTIYLSKNLRINKLRKKIIIILRSIIITLIILSLCGISMIWNAKNTTTIFLADMSDSVINQKNKIDNFIINSLKEKSSNDMTGIVGFGSEALVDSFVSLKPSFTSIQSKPNGTYTNLEEAINTSLSLMGENTKKRIVLISDGEENEGESSKLVPLLKEQGIDLKVYKIDKKMGYEAAVEDIVVPNSLRIGQDFSVVVNIKSNVKTGAKITLFSGIVKKASQRVELNKGNNRFVFKDNADSGGFKSYKVVIDSDKDTEIKNNEASAFTNVKDKPRILIIQDKNGEADEVIKMLKASNIEYDMVLSQAAPTALKTISRYKSIITCNVSAENLSDKFLNLLEPYVKDLGGGFVAVGGDNSFALGGYFKTPLETILPVYMDLRGRKEVPNMAMNLVIDKSGSMSGEKLELAKEAAARTLDALRENKDEIGVLTFDDSQYWVVKNQAVKDKKELRNAIGTIREGGGTSILPALEEAYDSIKKSNAKIKHIILLTDGQAERAGYEELIENMKKDNITVSTVAVGQGSDRLLLENIAKQGRGRFYYTDVATNIPRIFAKEAFMAARTYINNEEFTPVIENYHSILSGAAEDGLPNLLGYIAATPKNTSRVILKSSEEDPILTVWRYGLGKTAAWNSDMNGKWSLNYVGWDKNLRLWQNLINWTFEDYSSENVTVDASIKGNNAEITLVDGQNGKELLDTEAEILTPSMEKIHIKLNPTEPGKYNGEFNIKETGAYMIKSIQSKDGEVVSTSITGVNLPYSPEYKLDKKTDALEILVSETGGTFINSPEEVFKGKVKEVKGKRDLTQLLLIIALILFVIDIAFRRLNLPFAALENKLQSAKNKNKSNNKSIGSKKINFKNSINKNNNNQGTSENTVDSNRQKEKAVRQEIKNKKDKKKEEKEILNTGALLRKKREE